MQKKHEHDLAGGTLVLLLLLSNAIVLERGLVANECWYNWLFVTTPLLLVSIIVFLKKSFTHHG